MIYLLLALVIVNSILIITQERRITKKIIGRFGRKNYRQPKSVTTVNDQTQMKLELEDSQAQ
jgi:hypothetical protein